MYMYMYKIYTWQSMKAIAMKTNVETLTGQSIRSDILAMVNQLLSFMVIGE